jgi:Uma2 family endonuclease
MKPNIIQKTFASEEEYFLFEEKCELRNELVNGNLIAMSGVSIEHNEITVQVFLLLKTLLKGGNYRFFIEAVKVKNPSGNFFYPDVMVCHPNPHKYYSDQPILLVEVLSESTRTYDLTDKFIQYKQIPSLHYYLCVEPEQQVVIFYFKNAEGEWMTETYSKEADVINLPQLNTSFTLKDIYKPE